MPPTGAAGTPDVPADGDRFGADWLAVANCQPVGTPPLLSESVHPRVFRSRHCPQRPADIAYRQSHESVGISLGGEQNPNDGRSPRGTSRMTDARRLPHPRQ